MNNENLHSMSVIELKSIAKELGIKNITKFKKSELIEEIKRVSLKSNEVENKENGHKDDDKIQPAQIKKEGIILKEKLTKRELVEEDNIYENNKTSIKEDSSHRDNKTSIKEDNNYAKTMYSQPVIKDLERKLRKLQWKKRLIV